MDLPLSLDRQPPVRLTESAVPSGIRVWSMTDACTWAVARSPWWSAPALATAVVVTGCQNVLVEAPELACDQAPGSCGPEWLFVHSFFGSLLLTILASFAFPPLAILGAAVAAALTLALRPVDPADFGETWAWWLLLTGLGWTTLAAVARLRRASAQRRIATTAAGSARHPIPTMFRTKHQKMTYVQLVLGLASALLSVLSAWRTSTAVVWFAIPAAFLLWSALQTLAQTRRLRPGAAPVPALRVEVSFDFDTTIMVLPVGSPTNTPLFKARAEWWPTAPGDYPVSPPGEGDAAGEEDSHAFDRVERPASVQPVPPELGIETLALLELEQEQTLTCEAILYGAPYTGGKFVMLVAMPSTAPYIVVSRGRIRPQRIRNHTTRI